MKQEEYIYVNQNNLLDELINLAAEEYPKTNFGFLNNAIYSSPLSTEDQQHAIQLLRFTRELQLQNPIYETLYQHLLYLFVLNGSRLGLLKSIDRRLRGLVENQGAVMFISGVSGIGKTSLVMAFQERVQKLGAKFIPCHCSESDSSPYTLWQAVTRSISWITGIPFDSLHAPLGHAKEIQSAQELKQVLSGWLYACAFKQPLVILLDDIHWADADSLEVLNYLIHEPVRAPILYIATHRSEETHNLLPLNNFLLNLRRNGELDFLHLVPLTTDDTARLVAAFYSPCSPQLAQYLHHKAEGHPLFSVELLHTLVEQNLLPRDKDGYLLPPEQSITIPAFLKQLINQRVSQLGSQVERLLAIGAVTGESWSLNIVEPVVGIPEKDLLEAIECALRAEVITIEDDKSETYRFSHGLFREVLYSQQLTRHRKQLHRKIAEQFVQQQPSNIYAIAHHLYEAEAWEQAITACLAAGEATNGRYANYSALRWYQQALNAAENTGNTLDLAVALAIYDRLGRTHMALGHRQQAEIIYSRMRDVSQSSGDLIAEGYALINLASVQLRLYQLDLAERSANEALQIGVQTNDLRLMTNIYACFGDVLIARGQLDQAAIYHSKAMENIELLGDSGRVFDMLRLCTARATWVGQYQEAEKFARLALQLSQNVSDPLSIAGTHQALTFVQIESGRYLEAYQTISTTLKAIQVSGSHHHQEPRLLNLMGYLHLELGDAQEALDWDQKALDVIHDALAQSHEIRRYTLLNLATDYLHLGRLDEAQETIAQFEAIKEGAEFVRFRYFNRYQLLMCEFYLHKHKYEQAIELAQEARSLAESKRVRKNIAKSHWLEGQAQLAIMRIDKALGHLNQAVELVDEIQHGSLRWKIRLDLAKALIKAGNSPLEITQQTRDIMNRTSQSLLGSHLREIFIASHWIKRLEALEQYQTPEKLSYTANLTLRELEVLRLVSTGATNQQVADVLHISVRTVNTHMTNILNKTGCDNRTAASAFAVKHKLVNT